MMNISNPYVGERRPGSVGLPLPGISVQVRGPDGEILPDGETGELFVRGPNVFAGYWRRDEATRAAFVDGYFRTGDIGERSADKYYTLKGRRTDLIISGGFNIYPREIEEFLLEQEEITEASVVGVPDQVRGEVPVAYVVCAETFDPNASWRTLPRSIRVLQNSPRVRTRRSFTSNSSGQSAKTSTAPPLKYDTSTISRHRRCLSTSMPSNPT